ncbi:STAS domain-containing protein [uncultured Marivita sp.]|jgi:hypothetical protein|uniref:STAS domain-containing protein n=1 Tax=Marivita sp. TaxID=2003365 RepID=UPI0025F100BF|nr:STAS domain-containing protein [uncultured Marivita sp.]MCR9111470.1 STAS domain-containing protein [Paracoccaceae bacterium]
MAANQNYDLPANATISQCGKVQSSLRKLIEDNQDIIVTSDRVEQADLAMLQVLISAQKTAEQENKSFSVTADEAGTLSALFRDYGICMPQRA